MKKCLFLIVCAVVTLSLVLSACGSVGSCHYCGKSIGSDPVKAAGRTYCSYDCYMNEALFG